MSKKIQLSIPKPCHENWDAMTPVEKGKFCGSCAKEVVDFSTMSDRQVAEFFKKPILSSSKGGSVCGRFMVDQLERDIELPKKRLPWFKYFFSIALPAFFFAKASAQNNQKMGRVKPVTRDTMPSNINHEYRTMGMVALPDKFIPVEKGTQKGESGRVVDASTNMPLPAAQVYLFSTIGKEKIYVQRDGSFIIDIYRKITVDRIEISLPGYIPKTLKLADFLKLTDTKEPVKMEREDMIVGKIAMVDCVKPATGDMSERKKRFQGTIIDEAGVPVAWATIIIKNTRIGVNSDNSGQFSINTRNGDVLVIRGGINPIEFSVSEDDKDTILSVRRVIVCGNISKKKIKREKSKLLTVEVNRIEKSIDDKKNLLEKSALKIYPNPTTSAGSISITMKYAEEGYHTIELLNLSGQQVLQKEVWIDADAKLLDLEIPNVATGSYFLVMTNKKTGKKISEKLIVQ
jgi:hypothetical protein